MSEKTNKLDVIRNDILRYLESTLKVKDLIAISICGIENYDGSVTEVPLFTSPWGMSQIILNCKESREQDISGISSQFPRHFGVREEKLEYKVNSDGFLETEESTEKVITLSADGFPEEAAAPDINADSITVKQAFNWYLYHIIKMLSEGGEKVVSIPDAVFALKNDLFLPDDFMPPALMRMVEGNEYVNVQITVDEIQPANGMRLIYLFAKCNQKGCFAPHSFYFDDLDGNPEKRFSFDRIKDTLQKSFEKLQSSTGYEDFTFSRLLRSVLYALEARKTRELGKPMFDESKIEILENRGLVKNVGGKAYVLEDFDVSGIKRLMKESEEKVSILAENWLKSQIDTVGS